jgi:hypothetical protein
MFSIWFFQPSWSFTPVPNPRSPIRDPRSQIKKARHFHCFTLFRFVPPKIYSPSPRNWTNATCVAASARLKSSRNFGLTE